MKQGILSLFFLLILWSCNTASQDDTPQPEEDKIGVINVYTVDRNNAPETDDPNEQPSIEEQVEAALSSTQFEEGSILYVSQLGKTLNPYFPEGYNVNDNTSDPGTGGSNPDDDNLEATNTLYTYLYKERPGADWDNFYNFYPVENTEYLEWSAIRQRGAVGNGYSLFAFFFPGDNTIHFGVEQDQTDPEALVKSNVLGAYHSSSTLFSRLRFRLFHLMIYLKVNLYVPVYDPSDNSGYLADGFQETLLLKPMTNFGISWRVERSSDIDPPFVQPDPASMVDYIKPYAPESNANPIIIPDLEVGDYTDGTSGKTDKVYKYTFHMILPPQGTNYSNGTNFLQFKLLTPGGSERYYYFNDQLFAQGQAGDRFTLIQGTKQNLELYLPRKGNQTILIQASVNDWNEATSDMPMFDTQPPSNN